MDHEVTSMVEKSKHTSQSAGGNSEVESSRIKLKGISVELYHGSIVDLDSEVDALVNAANTHLWMGSGVAGAIKRQGGEEIEKDAIRQGPIPLGEAILSIPGKLKCKYVIHAAAMEPGGKASESLVRNATKNSLLRAEEKDLKSIAIPALGTGVGGFPIEQAAKVQLDEVKKFAEKAKTLRKVIFAIYDEHSYNLYKKELERL